MSEVQKIGPMTGYEITKQELEELKDHVNIAPNGAVFVKPHIRQGVLGRMVKEILETRVMVKQSMKLYPTKKRLLRTLQAKQLGLKLLANVTYGYTAASFSGRMPSAEIADAIVQTGRSTLERSIEYIHSSESFKGCTVVYADTDSLFVSLADRSKTTAFKIGNEIAALITNQNPVPMKLNFEKVYLPCVLLAKKRYVGFMYENISDHTPVFDAKGIETVRRDGCPAVAKLMESCLK
jgi:DNA polymerase zeta